MLVLSRGSGAWTCPGARKRANKATRLRKAKAARAAPGAALESSHEDSSDQDGSLAPDLGDSALSRRAETRRDENKSKKVGAWHPDGPTTLAACLDWVGYGIEGISLHDVATGTSYLDNLKRTVQGQIVLTTSYSGAGAA